MARSSLITNNNPSTNKYFALDLTLIDKEILGAIITIAAYIILIISAQGDRGELISRRTGNAQGESRINPASLATISSILIFIGSLILGQVAFIRLRERAEIVQSGEDSGSLAPNINIAFGYALAIAANFFKALGAEQREAEAARVTIV